jgi:hypothetical protein
VLTADGTKINIKCRLLIYLFIIIIFSLNISVHFSTLKKLISKFSSLIFTKILILI